MSINKPIKSNKKNGIFSGKLNFFIVFLFLISSGAILLIANFNNNVTNDDIESGLEEFTVSVRFELTCKNNESDYFIQVDKDFFYGKKVILEDILDTLDIEYYNKLREDSGFSWRLYDTDELVFESLDIVLVNSLTKDIELDIHLIQLPNRPWLNIGLGGGRFTDNNFDYYNWYDDLGRRVIHNVYHDDTSLNIQINYGTLLNELLEYIYQNHIEGVGIYTRYNLYKRGDANPFDFNEDIYMPDYDIDFDIRWIVDPGTHLAGNAFDADGPLSHYLAWNLYADMDEDEMLASVKRTINEFGYDNNRSNVHSNNFTIEVLREAITIDGEDGESTHFYTAIITINRIRIENLNFNGTAQELLSFNGFDFGYIDFFLDMTETQIRIIIEDQMLLTGRTNLRSINFDIRITNLHRDNLTISIYRIAFGILGYNLDGTAIRQDLLSSSILQLQSSFFKDMTEEQIRNELNRIMDTSNDEFERIHSTHFTIDRITGYHTDTLYIYINRIELTNITALGTAFNDTDYNVRVLETLDLSNLFVDYTEILIRTELLRRINNLDSTTYFNFNTNYFTSPVIGNIHTTDLSIRIDRVSIVATINGTALLSDRFNEVELKNEMVTLFRDLTEYSVLNKLSNAIDSYFITPGNIRSSNLFNVTYLKSDYDSISLTINRINIYTVGNITLHGNALLEDNTLLHANNLQINTNIFKDMNNEELRILLFNRINYISGPRFSEDHFNIPTITGAHTSNLNITISRVEVSIEEDGNAFTDNILNVDTLRLEELIFRDMTEDIIRTTLINIMDASTNVRINSNFFTIEEITNVHTATITLYVSRNSVTPNVNGTAHNNNTYENILAGRLEIDTIFMDMRQSDIVSLVQANIDAIDGIRFNHRNFDPIIVTGYQTANISIIIDRYNITPNVSGRGFNEISRVEGITTLLTGIYRDMEEYEIRSILRTRLNGFNNPRFVYENFEVVIPHVHVTNLIININGIIVTPTIDYLGGAGEFLPSNLLEFMPNIYKDMTNAWITNIVYQTIEELTGNYSGISRSMFMATSVGNHTENITITILPRTAGVRIQGSAIDDEIISYDLLADTLIYLADDEEAIRQELIYALENLDKDNLIYTNFDIVISGVNTDYVSITINRRSVSNISITGSAAVARDDIYNLNVTNVFYDMLDNCVRGRVAVALIALNQVNLRMPNFVVTVSGNHSSNMTITINRTTLTTVTVTGGAITDSRFTQTQLNLPTIYRDNTENEIRILLNNAINNQTYFRYEFFEIDSQITRNTALMATAATLTVNRIAITPHLEGTAVTNDLLNANNLNINDGFYLDMDYYEVYNLISSRINNVPGVRFSNSNFYYSEYTILNVNTLNLVIGIERILITDISLDLPLEIEDLLTVSNLQLDTHIFKDMTNVLIRRHLTDRMNILSATNSRISSQHFTVGLIQGTHSSTIVIPISRILVTVDTDGNAFAPDLLTSENLRLDTQIFRDMTNQMIYTYLRDRLNDMHEDNARIRYEHFNVSQSSTTRHQSRITIYISRILVNVTVKGTAFTDGPLTAALIGLNTTIFKDMTEDMIINLINNNLDNVANPRVHSSFFEIIGDITPHVIGTTIEIDRVSISIPQANLQGTAFTHGVLSDINLPNIYFDMEETTIITLVNNAINALGTSENRINTTNFTVPVIAYLHTSDLRITVDRISIIVDIAGTAITTYRRFTLGDLDLTSLEIIFYRDMLASDIIEVVEEAINVNLDAHFESTMFNVRATGRNVNSITIYIDRVVTTATVVGNAITDNRFSQEEILTAIAGRTITLYRDTFDWEFIEFVEDAINTLTGRNERFISDHFTTTSHVNSDHTATITIARNPMDIRLDGSAFARLSGDEDQQNAHNIGVTNFRSELRPLFMDMTQQEVVNEMLDALDRVGNTLNRPTFNRRTFFIGFVGRIDNENAISFTINRAPITDPSIQGGAVGEESGVDAPWN